MYDGWKIFEVIKGLWFVFAACFFMVMASPPKPNNHDHSGPPRHM